MLPPNVMALLKHDGPVTLSVLSSLRAVSAAATASTARSWQSSAATFQTAVVYLREELMCSCTYY